MAMSNNSHSKIRTKPDNTTATEKDTLTDSNDKCVDRNANDASNNAASETKVVEEEVSDEPAAIKFHEVIGHDNTGSGPEAYINYVLNNYEPASPECVHYLDIIKRSFVQPQFCHHFENIVESSTSHTQTYNCIREVVDDVMQDLIEKNIDMSCPLTSSEEQLLQTLVANRVLRQQVNTYVAKIIQRAIKQLELEAKRSVLKAGDKVFNVVGTPKTWSLENLNVETSVPETADPSLEQPKVKEAQPMYANLPRYLPAYRPHKDSSEYVALPYLYNLPAYTKAPFPIPLHKHMSPSSWRTTKLGHSTYTVPTFYLSQGTTQVFSKLIKYYNSLK